MLSSNLQDYLSNKINKYMYNTYILYLKGGGGGGTRVQGEEEGGWGRGPIPPLLLQVLNLYDPNSLYSSYFL